MNYRRENRHTWSFLSTVYFQIRLLLTVVRVYKLYLLTYLAPLAIANQLALPRL